jgi:Protein of unknown function (DUF732)
MRRSFAAPACVLGALFAAALGTSAPSQADQVAYLVNVHVRPVYHFPNAEVALDYGYGLCDRITRGEGYPALVALIKRDFNTDDEFSASYLLSQATQELCPAQIWQLRQSAAGYRPTP